MKYPKYIDYALLIAAGVFLLFEQAKDGNANIYILIGGLFVFMYGLYRVTSIWTKDNPRPPRKDEFPSFDDNTFEQDKEDKS